MNEFLKAPLRTAVFISKRYTQILARLSRLWKTFGKKLLEKIEKKPALFSLSIFLFLVFFLLETFSILSIMVIVDFFLSPEPAFNFNRFFLSIIEPFTFFSSRDPGKALVITGFSGMLITGIYQVWNGGIVPLPFIPPVKLITGGIYYYSRNPVLLMLYIFMSGLALESKSLFFSFFFVPLLLLIKTGYVLDYEEPSLLKHFGREYEAYYRRTPFLLPRFRIVAEDINFLVVRLGRIFFNPAVLAAIIFAAFIILLLRFRIENLSGVIFAEENARYVILVPLSVLLFLFFLSILGSLRLLASGIFESPFKIFMMGFKFQPVWTGMKVRILSEKLGLGISLAEIILSHARGRHMCSTLNKLESGAALIAKTREGFYVPVFTDFQKACNRGPEEEVFEGDRRDAGLKEEGRDFMGYENSVESGGTAWMVWGPVLLGIILGSLLAGFQLVKFPVLTTAATVIALVGTVLFLIMVVCFTGSLWLSTLGISFPPRVMFELGFNGYPVKSMIFALARGAKNKIFLTPGEIVRLLENKRTVEEIEKRINITGAILRSVYSGSHD